MEFDRRRWGEDLQLLRNLERQSDHRRNRDLAVRRRPGTGETDLATLDGADNLRQALLLRLLTPVGELAALGHPSYGSRLFELIGERNTERTRNRAKLYTLQALAAEPRIQEVRLVQVTPNPSDRTRIDIRVAVVAGEAETLLNLVFPFSLEGGTA